MATIPVSAWILGLVIRHWCSSTRPCIVQRRDALVATIMQSIPLNIQFRRMLVGDRWEAWLHLVSRLMEVQLAHQPD